MLYLLAALLLSFDAKDATDTALVEALEEDSPQVEIVALRAGDAYVVGESISETASS